MSKKNYRPEIDGLRALAVIAVIVNHFNKDILPSGYLGVDIFFVISGFVITASLAYREASSFFTFITGFYVRRVKRLVPALIFCVVLTALITCLVNPFPNVSINTGVTSLVGLSNIYLLRQATDYFGSSAELNTFTQTWSLGVEEQFYFLFPVLVWMTGFSRHTKRGARNLFFVMTVFVLSSFCLFAYLSGQNPSAAYFLMPSRLWEMGSGCLLFLGLSKLPSAAVLSRWLKPELLIGCLIAAFFLPLSFQVLATVLTVCVTSLLIVVIRPGTSAYRLLTLKPALFIGLISYSLYLWHWSVLAISRWTIGIHWWSVPFQLGLMFLLAFLSYRYIESPLRHLRWSTNKVGGDNKLGDIRYALLSSLLCAVLVFASARQYSSVKIQVVVSGMSEGISIRS
ncbi:MAG: acyltransferase family protein [Phormidesmis sp.]